METKLHKVDVYGTLMFGKRNAKLDEERPGTYSLFPQGNALQHWMGFPAFVPDEAGGDVHGELLTVTHATLARMDRLEGYPRLYRRERVVVALSDGTAEAVVYVMNRLPAQARILSCGDWREYRKNLRE